MGRIQINDLRCDVAIGINEAEQAQTQPILATIEIQLDLAKASETDSLEDTVDYFKLAKELQEEAQSGPCRLLEGLADRLATRALEDSRIQSVRVLVRKFPEAMKEMVESVQVEVIRHARRRRNAD